MIERGEKSELLRLIGAMIDGVISPEDHRRLEALLEADARARELYFDCMDVHFGLHRWQIRDAEARQITDFEEATVAASPLRERTATPGRAARYAGYAAVAAITLVASLAAQWVLFDAARHAVADPSPPEPGEYVATLVDTSQCDWGRDDVPRGEGSRLLPGRVHLVRGVAEIRFDSGAQLVLEGPAVLQIESVSSATVLQGKLVLKSDETAEAFFLHTPSSTLVDYGTEYAVAIDSGGEELHVFDGEVRRTARTRHQGHDPAEQVAAGQAKRYAGRPGRRGKAVPLGEHRFARQVPRPAAGRPDPTANLLAYEGFEYLAPAMPADGTADGGLGWERPWWMNKNHPMPLNVASLYRADSTGGALGGAIDGHGVLTISRRLKRPVRLDRDAVYYLSFLFRRLGGSGEPPNSLQLILRDPRQSEPQKRLTLGVARPNHVVFTHFEGGGGRAALPLDYEETYLLVAKIVAGRTRPDQVFLRVYRPDEPVGRSEPGSWSVTTRPVKSHLVLSSLSVHLNSEAPQLFDELRIGTTWSSVTAVWRP